MDYLLINDNKEEFAMKVVFTASLSGHTSITEEIDLSGIISEENLKSLDENSRELIIEQLFKEWLDEKVGQHSNWKLLHNFE